MLNQTSRKTKEKTMTYAVEPPINGNYRDVKDVSIYGRLKIVVVFVCG